jgi:glutamate 5-kinase
MTGRHQNQPPATPLTATPLATARRLVVKIGSALLVDSSTGRIRRRWLDALIDDIAGLHAHRQQVVIVSSGAIAAGRHQLGLTHRNLRLEEKQAAAATGQIRLAHAYQDSLNRHQLTVAQILLSAADTEIRRRHLNARATIQQLLDLGAVPVINENDSVTTEEIRFGDNDRLGARVAQMISADTLLLLSDIDGLYQSDPKTDPQAAHIPVVTSITPTIEAMAGSAGSDFASGGMVTKIAAAKIATGAGCQMAILDGKQLHPIKQLQNAGRATWFQANGNPGGARKRWIASGLNPQGKIHLDAGAIGALDRGKSLLPAGVTHVAGDFARGDLVRVINPAGHEVGRGLTAYSANDAAKIIGHKSRDIEAILGYRGRDEIIHRDDLVMVAATDERE